MGYLFKSPSSVNWQVLFSAHEQLLYVATCNWPCDDHWNQLVLVRCDGGESVRDAGRPRRSREASYCYGPSLTWHARQLYQPSRDLESFLRSTLTSFSIGE